MLLRNRMLGGVSSFALFDRAGEGAGSGESEDKHTDVVLMELANQAFDDAEAAAGEAGDRGGERQAPEKVAGEQKPGASDRKAEPAKRDGEPAAGEDRGDGRRADGKWAKKAAVAAEKAGADPQGEGKTGTDAVSQAKAGEQQLGQDQQQQGAVKAAPPPSWSPTAKAAWEKLPDAVRADIAKREAEVSEGFALYAGVKPFAERAKAAGQTLGQALQAYTGIEDLVRRDLDGGILHIVQNAGKTQHEAATMFARLAQRLGFQFQAPADQNAGGSQADQNAGADPNMLQRLLEPVLKPILEKVNNLDTTFARQAEGEKTQRLTASQAVVNTFRQDPANRYYDNVEQTIGDLLANGGVKRTGDLAADLKAAYETACWQNPEIRELLINERTAAAGTQQRSDAQALADRKRAASRSVTGAPAGGGRDTSRGRGDSLQSLAEQAYDSAAGRV
jgi:hypothetical protein